MTQRSDKGQNRVIWVEAPCSCGCENTVKRRASEAHPTMFFSRSCYQKFAKRAILRVGAYERLYGPLPEKIEKTFDSIQ